MSVATPPSRVRPCRGGEAADTDRPGEQVTIIPRGRALCDHATACRDRYSRDRDRLLQTIAVLFGGRIAEEIFMNQMTTAHRTISQRATDPARRMVTVSGRPTILGPMVCGEEDGEIFLWPSGDHPP